MAFIVTLILKINKIVIVKEGYVSDVQWHNFTLFLGHNLTAFLEEMMNKMYWKGLAVKKILCHFESRQII